MRLFYLNLKHLVLAAGIIYLSNLPVSVRAAEIDSGELAKIQSLIGTYTGRKDPNLNTKIEMFYKQTTKPQVSTANHAAAILSFYEEYVGGRASSSGVQVYKSITQKPLSVVLKMPLSRLLALAAICEFLYGHEESVKIIQSLASTGETAKFYFSADPSAVVFKRVVSGRKYPMSTLVVTSVQAAIEKGSLIDDRLLTEIVLSRFRTLESFKADKQAQLSPADPRVRWKAAGFILRKWMEKGAEYQKTIGEVAAALEPVSEMTSEHKGILEQLRASSPDEISKGIAELIFLGADPAKLAGVDIEIYQELLHLSGHRNPTVAKRATRVIKLIMSARMNLRFPDRINRSSEVEQCLINLYRLTLPPKNN